MNDTNVEAAYALARDRYAGMGVNTDVALERLAGVSISLPCWQGDDVSGFEKADSELGGGLAVTGKSPGKPRNADELRGDAEKAFSLIPGRHRFNLHAIYAETGDKRVDRDHLEPQHFAGWIDWARRLGIGLDFNPTCFSHPLAAGGFTLSHPDRAIRQFWIDHCRACRRIGAAMGAALGSPTVTNVWVPDGYKDTPFDRRNPRERLAAALDEVFAEPIDSSLHLDAIEGKLFGIGSESYVVGSHEFYFGYAVQNRKLLCLDAGHYHPTESIADKISAVLVYLDEILLHVSRGVRWDSDHVATLTDDLKAVGEEIVRGGYLKRVHIGLDFFDASINRVAAWVIGARATLKALLLPLLEPARLLEHAEMSGDYTGRLALLEEAKGLPFGAVWDYYCLQNGVPAGIDFLAEIRTYERDVLGRRSSEGRRNGCS